MFVLRDGLTIGGQIVVCGLRERCQLRRNKDGEPYRDCSGKGNAFHQYNLLIKDRCWHYLPIVFAIQA